MLFPSDYLRPHSMAGYCYLIDGMALSTRSGENMRTHRESSAEGSLDASETPDAASADGHRVLPDDPAHARNHMMVSGIRAEFDDGLAESGYNYEQFATLAGPLTHPPRDQPYQVQYRSIHHSTREWVTTRLIALMLVLLDVGFMYWLIFKSQYPDLNGWLWRGSLHAIQADGDILLLAGMAGGSIL